MVNVLLLLSMVLNGVTLFCIVILYLRQNRLLEVEKKQEKLMKEMEEVISSYLLEMTEENDEFIKKVKELIAREPLPSSENNLVKPVKHSVENEEKVSTETQPTLRKGTVYQAVQAYKNVKKVDESSSDDVVLPPITKEEIIEHTPIPDKKTGPAEKGKQSSDLYAQSFYYQALLLQKQGLSTEDIARRLNKGKTEIELLLKLRQNEKE